MTSPESDHSEEDCYTVIEAELFVFGLLLSDIRYVSGMATENNDDLSVRPLAWRETLVEETNFLFEDYQVTDSSAPKFKAVLDESGGIQYLDHEQP